MPTSKPFLQDPLWYKDAVIYELHVRSFYDASGDGYGDFEGLRQKLPYLESLGVNTLWLLPFLESPLRDDGYDTADYLKILPVHGDLDDFKAFVSEAHGRGMRVITELVLNHTSDQHPWFQEARDPNSPKHDWYVWSDTTEKYAEARIIFTDTEVSNWTWDRKAQRYYWHRFFAHQPDLNYDNADVRAQMKEVMFYWLDLGVDGLRLDAVPYLYEREGTSCENLPETIDFIVELRQAIEERYGPGKVLLAEANQWPEDTLPYFADGKGVQMSFNFPIMPRMYMALRRENRYPLAEMLELTKDVPEDAQWAIFLRNHDELTLEMVTDEERDYMYHEYATDARFRINVGIRRRLAPLLGGERRRIELMNALLLSLKGSPVVYYGDEIGMGDDPFLGDRNGVRTPMQWSPDKNGGFSRAPHHRLFMPAIDRGPYSYEFVNAEDAERDPYSLLGFTRRILAIRQQHVKTFGRGTFTLLPVENQSILAFVREYEGERILVVANLSRFVQSTFLPKDNAYGGLVPVELFSKAAFPPIGDDPYHLALGPHGFYWFSLVPQEETAGDQAMAPTSEGGALPVVGVREGLQNMLVKTMADRGARQRLEELLPSYLQHQRWFGAKGRAVRRVTVEDAVRLQAHPFPVYLSILNVEMEGAENGALYVLPLASTYAEEADRVLQERPQAALAWIDGPNGRGLLHDATASPDFWTTLFRWWQSERKGRSLKGLYAAQVDEAARDAAATTARLLSGEQSNSAAIVGKRFFVKLYRRMEKGANPETELLDYLTDAGFKYIPRLHGTLGFKSGPHQYAMGILQEALPVESDAWTYALEATGRFFDRAKGSAPPEEDRLPQSYHDTLPVWLEEVATGMLSMARILGIRTAEMHLAFGQADVEGIRPEPGRASDVEALVERVRRELGETRERLADATSQNGTLDVPADARWDEALHRLDGLKGTTPLEKKIRIHGDYHLGQVVRAAGQLYLLDFEGEPARSLEERRRHDMALRDVAGMLRSLEYAVLAAWQERTNADPELEAWTSALVRWCEALFLNAYYSTAGDAAFLRPGPSRDALLWAYLLDKALYEVRYELGNRPGWAWLPLRGLRRLLSEETITASAER